MKKFLGSLVWDALALYPAFGLLVLTVKYDLGSAGFFMAAGWVCVVIYLCKMSYADHERVSKNDQETQEVQEPKAQEPWTPYSRDYVSEDDYYSTFFSAEDYYIGSKKKSRNKTKKTVPYSRRSKH